jgi:hypothetical protein
MCITAGYQALPRRVAKVKRNKLPLPRRDVKEEQVAAATAAAAPPWTSL